MKKIILALLLISSVSQGCAAFQNKLPAVISAVTDGVMIVDAIRSFANAYFIAHPDAAKQLAVNTAIDKAETALDAGLRIVNATDSLNQAKVDEAFLNFKAAYTELVALVESIGVKASGPALAASPKSLVVPDPLLVKLKI